MINKTVIEWLSIHIGTNVRVSSPWPGGSTLITLAPIYKEVEFRKAH